MIMSGTHNARIEAVQALDIHGTVMYDVVYVHEGETTARRARLGAESVYVGLAPGDTGQVSYLMNVANGLMRRVEA